MQSWLTLHDFLPGFGYQMLCRIHTALDAPGDGERRSREAQRFPTGAPAPECTSEPSADCHPRASPGLSARCAPLVALILCLLGCEVPEGRVESASHLPSALLAEITPDTVRERELGEGVRYHFLWSAEGPWAIHLVSADIAHCSLDLQVVPAVGGPDGTMRLRLPVSVMAPTSSGQPLAGINGDFFRLDNGIPLGPEVTSGTWRLAARPAFLWQEGAREPWIGTPVAVGGGDLGFGSDTLVHERGSPGMQVVGGYPELLAEGRVASDLGVRDRPAFALNRHPRTAVGFDVDTGRLWMVVVDGRQEPRSAGMSLIELANLLLWLGAEEALNLDGGGSSTMIVEGAVANSPSDAEGERPVGNSLWLLHDPEACSLL